MKGCFFSHKVVVRNEPRHSNEYSSFPTVFRNSEAQDWQKAAAQKALPLLLYPE